jgi:hypothetical protein
MIDYDGAQRVLRHKQVMKPEVVAEAVVLIERVVLAGMIAFATGLPRDPRRQLDLTFDGQA